MARDLDRRAFLGAVLVGVPLARHAGAQSAAERLIAAMQDGGKIIYLRHGADPQEIDTGRVDDRTGQRHLSPAGIRQAQTLGRALRALRVPLNEIVASPVGRARETAELAFGADRVRVDVDLVADDSAGDRRRARLDATRRLLRTAPGPGMNRILVGHRTPLERATERQFPDSVLPEGAMAVFLPGQNPQLLGTITAERVIASAEARGAM